MFGLYHVPKRQKKKSTEKQSNVFPLCTSAKRCSCHSRGSKNPHKETKFHLWRKLPRNWNKEKKSISWQILFLVCQRIFQGCNKAATLWNIVQEHKSASWIRILLSIHVADYSKAQSISLRKLGQILRKWVFWYAGEVAT